MSLTEGPTVVIGRKGSFGEVHYSAVGCWPIDTTYYVDESSTSADLRWLYYRMGSLRLTDLNRAAAIPGLNREDAYRQRLLLPPISEQRRIAAILDKADEVRAKRRAALETLETLSQATFVDMFGDPVSQTYQDTPNGGEATTLGRVSTIRTGKLDANASVDGGLYPFFTCSKQTLAINDAAFDGKAILVAGNGDLNVKYYEGRFNAYQRTYVIQSRNEDHVLPRFLHGYLDLYVRELRRQAIGGVIKYIKLPYLTEAVVHVPDEALQAEYLDRICSIEAIQHNLSNASYHADLLFMSLQHEAFQ